MNPIDRLCQLVLKRIEHEQYFPGLLALFVNPFFHARRGLERNIRQLSHHVIGKTLDVGCGRKPYRGSFGLVTEYVGLEYDSEVSRQHSMADVFYDGKKFPFADSSFDSIVCNEVLEHVFNPKDFLGEIYRVLKPGGRVLLTVPFVWDEHEQPLDYARYSCFGLRHLLTCAHLEIVEHRKSVNDIAVIFQLINAYFVKVIYSRKKSRVSLAFVMLLTAPFNILGAFLSILLPVNDDLYLDNVVVVKKAVY